MMPIRKIVQKLKHFVVHHILHSNDTPHRIALGAALGGFCAWTPTIGFQMILVVLIASALRANRLISIIIVWISNPLTLIPIYYPNYRVGRALLEIFTDRPKLSHDQLVEMLRGWNEFGRFILNISLDLWVGSIVVGLFVGGLFYLITYKWVVWYRTHTHRGRRHAAQIQRRQEKA